MSKKPSKPETRIEDYLDVMTGGNAALPQPILRIEFYYAFLAGITVELPQPILDDEKLLAKICGMEVEAPTYIPGLSPRLYAYMAKKGGQDVQVPDPILRLECYWYDYSAGSPQSVQEYTGAVPVTFVADGTPLLDYLISGNTVQNGTPTPDNPIMPQGTGERTGQLITRATFPPNYLGFYVSDLKKIVETEATFTLSFKSNITFRNNSVYLNTPGFPARVVATVSGTGDVLTTFTLTEADISNIKNSSGPYFRVYKSDTDFSSSADIMLNLGSTAKPYEPYGVKIPISSANTTTPVYLGEVQTTRKIIKYEFNGSEAWAKNSTSATDYIYYLTALKEGLTRIDMLCSHLPIATTGISPTNAGVQLFSNRTTLLINVGSDVMGAQPSGNTVAGLKEYLSAQYAAGTPVCVWYVLANEETGIVNEPLMRIGDYADTLSMEQAGVQIPTANGSTTLDVETTVKPSEVYIKYRDEAVATLSALPAEVSSPEETPEEVNPEEMEEEENEC